MSAGTRRCLRVFLLVTALLIAFSSFAADRIPIDKFDSDRDIAASASTVPAVLPLSGDATIQVKLVVPDGFHITSRSNDFFAITAKDTLGIHFGEWIYPKPAMDGEEEVYRGTLVIRSKVKLSNAEWTTAKIPLGVGYQVCAEFGARTCFLPSDRTIYLTLKKGGDAKAVETAVVEAPPTVTTPEVKADSQPPATAQTITPVQSATVKAEAKSDESLEARFGRALQEGSLFAFLLVFLGGVFASLTPCVYPVIPITMGYIGSRSGGSKLRGFTLSLAFVLGLAIVYSSLGLIAASTGSLFGSFTQTPWFLGSVGLLIGVMGVSMLGVFDIPIPGFAAEAQSNPKGGYFGAAVMGGLSGLVAAPCVGPILVALLAWVAQTGSLWLGFFLLFTFSIGMGLLFIAIGTFSGLLQSLPAAGEWMVAVKKFFGFAMLAGALYLVKAFLPPLLSVFAWSILLAFGGMMLWGKSLGEDDDVSLGFAFKRGLALLMLALSLIALIHFAGEVFGWRVAPAAQVVASGTGSSTTAAIPWRKNDEQGVLNDAKAQGKPVLVDFYADWCAACVELDEKTWPDAGVIDATKSALALKFDFTKQDEWTKSMMDKYHIQGLPTVLHLNADGTERARFTGYKSPAEFLDWWKNSQ